MLTLEIFEADDNNPYKTIYYRDADDIAIRTVQLDQSGCIVIDEITEFNQQKQRASITRYARDLVTILHTANTSLIRRVKKQVSPTTKQLQGTLR